MTRKNKLILTPQLKKRLILPAYLLAALLCGLLQYAGILYYNNTHIIVETSTGYRFTDSFAKTLSKYDTLNNLYLEELSFATPGLISTNILGDSSCQMVPQGICKAGDYILISAYNSSSSKWIRQIGKSARNSVIYILSSSGEYLNTMILPDVNHVGGLTYDGYRVWVAKSADKTCSIIPYENIQAAALAEEPYMQLESYLADAGCQRNASFVEYHDRKLWIGTFAKKGKEYSTVGIYEIGDENDSFVLNQISSIRLPAEAQGISFLEEDGKEYMIVSTSYGRFKNSVYYMYETRSSRDVYYLSYCGKCELPPMSEEMYTDGVYSYLMFESAATTYSMSPFRCVDPIDRVCVVENASLISMMQ